MKYAVGSDSAQWLLVIGQNTVRVNANGFPLPAPAPNVDWVGNSTLDRTARGAGAGAGNGKPFTFTRTVVGR